MEGGWFHLFVSTCLANQGCVSTLPPYLKLSFAMLHPKTSGLPWAQERLRGGVGDGFCKKTSEGCFKKHPSSLESPSGVSWVDLGHVPSLVPNFYCPLLGSANNITVCLGQLLPWRTHIRWLFRNRVTGL